MSEMEWSPGCRHFHVKRQLMWWMDRKEGKATDLCNTYIRGHGNGCRHPRQAVNLAAFAPCVEHGCPCFLLPTVGIVGLDNFAGHQLSEYFQFPYLGAADLCLPSEEKTDRTSAILPDWVYH